MRRFSMYRRGDESGVSVLGRVLDGVVFHTGQVVVCWRTALDATQGKGRGRSSLGIYASWEAFDALHIASHAANRTDIEWLDP